jgi:two-component system phosphate regulon sensor histidine kinase PhoR
VARANAAARTLLGQHILGQDVRVAIRHPAAAGPLASADEQPAKTHLVGLGTRDQRWEMRVARLSDGRRMVELIDQTDSYATERMRVDFVANASHELRTPLASLIGYVETLSDEAGDDPGTRRRFLQIMHGEASRMARLIDDLMSLSRIEAEKYRLPDEEVEMGPLILRVCEELGATGGRADDLVADVDAGVAVRGDSVQLSQLLHNIIGNALKYGRPETPVRVSLREEGSMVRIAVNDEGEGIAPEHIPRLTERFYRVDSGRSRAMGGTGLGLAIVRHIVERHRGRLDIASAVGKGTTVTVMLPTHRLS